MTGFWNDRYQEKEFAYGTKPNQFLAAELSKIQPGKILLPCDGEGRNAVYAAQNRWDVVAFDYSEEGRKKANSLAKEHHVNIEFQLADATVVEYAQESFDVIAFIYAHFPENIRISIHQKALKWLKPGGIILLEAFDNDQIKNISGGPKDFSLLYSEDILASDFKGLETLLLSTDEIELDEGIYHKGLANVVRYVGMKPKNDL